MRLVQRKVTAALKRHGYKLTLQRRAVIETIVSSHDHLTQADFYEKAQKKHSNIGLVTICHTLEIFTELVLICKAHAEDNCGSYLMSRPAGHHHQLICSDCGVVIGFTNCELVELERRVSRESDFRIDCHLREFTGLCQNCQGAT